MPTTLPKRPVGRPPKPQPPPPNMIREKYGWRFQPLYNQVNNQPIAPQPYWRIEYLILRNYEMYRKSALVRPWVWHYQQFVEAIWGNPACARRFVWNPNTEIIVTKAREEKFLGVAGSASSSKSETGALWAITSFLLGAPGPNGEPPDPKFTKVFVTSTTLEESRQRIWGVIEQYWDTACKAFGGEQNMPGKLVSSRGKIMCRMEGGKFTDLAGIALIPGGKGQDKDGSTKIGFKARNVVLIADELPLLTHRLYETAKGNLFSNPDFSMIGIGNLTSAFDPFGAFVEPEDGWGSVTEDYDGWKTKLGYCIRLDGLKSPNVLAGRELYPGLLTLEKVNGYIASLGPQSPEFYRMCRSFLCPTGNADTVFSEKELISGLAMQKVHTWESPPMPLAFLDPAWTHDGDRAVVAFGRCGITIHPITGARLKVLELTESIDLMKQVSAKSEEDISDQVVELYNAALVKRGIPIANAGIDATGGGIPFASLLAKTSGKGFHLVSFGGAPSEMRVSPVDKRTGKDKFCNRVSELWYVSKELAKTGQIKGITPETAVELCTRLYKNEGEKVRVEPKKQMRSRTLGKSPDFADAFVGLVDLARVKCGLSSAAKAALHPGNPAVKNKHADLLDNSWGVTRKKDFREEIPSIGGAGGWAD